MRPLQPWMKKLLWFVGGFNLLAGTCMGVFYHEAYKLLDIEKPALVLPLQLVGILVGLFGVGYWMVAVHPVENRNVLLLGLCSKTLGPAMAMVHVANGTLPPVFVVVLFFADLVYIPPFAVIYWRLCRLAGERATGETSCKDAGPVSRNAEPRGARTVKNAGSGHVV